MPQFPPVTGFLHLLWSAKGRTTCLHLWKIKFPLSFSIILWSNLKRGALDNIKDWLGKFRHQCTQYEKDKSLPHLTEHVSKPWRSAHREISKLRQGTTASDSHFFKNKALIIAVAAAKQLSWEHLLTQVCCFVMLHSAQGEQCSSELWLSYSKPHSLSSTNQNTSTAEYLEGFPSIFIAKITKTLFQSSHDYIRPLFPNGNNHQKHCAQNDYFAGTRAAWSSKVGKSLGNKTTSQSQVNSD